MSMMIALVKTPLTMIKSPCQALLWNGLVVKELLVSKTFKLRSLRSVCYLLSMRSGKRRIL